MSTAVAVPTATASTRTVGDADSRPSAAASVSDAAAVPGRTDCVRISTAKVIIATTVMIPSMLRVPKIPWMGPSAAMFPWIPRNFSGMSRRMPESTSSPSDSPSAARSTSPSARTVCSVSRMCPIVTASSATAAIAVHRPRLVNGSELQNTLANAHATSSSSVVGTRRSSEISSRRAERMPRANTHSPATTARSVTIPATRSMRCDPTSAANVVSVYARAKSADPKSRRTAPLASRPRSASRGPVPAASAVIAPSVRSRPARRPGAARTVRDRGAAPA